MAFQRRKSIVPRILLIFILLATLCSMTPASVRAERSLDAGPQGTDCDPNTGWMWTDGPARPEVAAQAQQTLSGQGIEADVDARSYGETDGCGSYHHYGIDFTVSLKDTASNRRFSEKGFVDNIVPILTGLGKPNLGNVRLISAQGKSIPVDLYREAPAWPKTISPSFTEPVTKKVYIIVYDPLLSNGQTLSERMHWNSHATITQQTIDFFNQASGGKVNYSVVDTAVVTSEWPELIDGFHYTEQSYLAVIANPASHHNPTGFNYNKMVNSAQFDICGKANRGEIDEVWVYNAPWFGFWESTLVGPGSYWYNSSPVPGPYTCTKLVPIMGPSVERTVGEAVHNFGHRAESTMSKVYGGWQENNTSHNWNKFALVKAQSPSYSYSGCGSTHYPANGTTDYAYSSSASVSSNCEDFRNYPNLGNPLQVAQPVTCSAWGCNHLDYLRYWFSHMPSYAGCGADGTANDWWEYITDPGLALSPSSACQAEMRSISGNVQLGDVTLSFVDGDSRSVTSNSSGNYSLMVSAGWSGTITPSKAGYLFTPASREYQDVQADLAGQNYTPRPDLALTYYVDRATGSNSNQCTSPAAPCRDIQETLNKANPGATLYIASGTYSFSTNPTPNVIVIRKNITLSGGWNHDFTAQIGASIVDGAGVNNGILAASGIVTVENFVIQNSVAFNSGAIYLGSGSFTLSRSTLRNNTASSNGGGIFVDNGSLTVINSTISGNTAGDTGGGIYAAFGSGASANIQNSTITYNSAARGGGLGRTNGTYHVINTILANNSSTISGPDCQGTLASASYTILEDPGGCSITTGSHNLNIDPLVSAALSGNIPTHITLANSAAIDQGDDAHCPQTDQRGVTRPQGSHCDIGAYEYTGSILYVKADATGAQNGSSWTDAYTDLQAALAAAAGSEEIWVAAGTYKPTTGTDRSVSFILKNDVAVYGGFAGTESTREQRDPAAHPAVLSGDLGTPGDFHDNSYHVVVASGTTASAVLDGFTIRGGNANGEVQDRSGGGVYNEAGTPTLTNLLIRGNAAADQGGGMYIGYTDTGGNPTLTNVTFQDNTAYLGGGLEVSLGSPVLVNVTFSGNAATYGGGFLNRDTASTPTLINVTFDNNTALISGGAVAFTGSPIVRNSIFWRDVGGEIYTVGPGSPRVTYSLVQGGYAGEGNLSADPLLSPLHANGGFTPTMALDAASPAVNAGDDTNCPATDQRGVARPNGAQCDIGAYEYEGFPLPTAVTITSSSDQSVPGESIYVTVTVTSAFGTPAGTVDFSIDGVLICSGLTLNSNSTASCTMSFAASGTIQAAYHSNSSNYQSSSASLYHVVVADVTPPLVSSIIHAGVATHTAADSVSWTVTFSEAVTGISTSAPFTDFALTTTGVSGAAITGVSASTATTYTVTANTGSGNGTIRLDVPATATISDLAANPLAGLPFTAGETYTIEKTPILPAGTYDDTHTAWGFSSGWTTYTGAGPANRTSHYTNAAGREAQISFNGSQFKLTYVKASNRGLIDVYVDGTKIDTINAKSSTLVWQATWTSPVLTPGIHNVRFVHAGGGTYVDIDAIQFFIPLDPVAPGAIGDLTAATGAAPGSVDLRWTAPGDDNTSGTVTSYLVRYSTSAITNETEWNAAAPLTTGLPTPVVAGTIQTMTASGLTPGATYFFAVRAVDEESNTGALSNSPSAAAQSIVPVATGTYDDTDVLWIYSGTWTAYTGAGPLNGTWHTASAAGSEAQMAFNGTGFSFTYVKASNRGLIDVYVDGTKVGTINARSSTLAWQATWSSPDLAPGTHTVRFVHAGGGTYIDIDAIRVLGDPPVVGPGTYDDADPAWLFGSGWTTYTGTGAFTGTWHTANTTGSQAQITFNGTGFTFTYVKASNRGLIDVYVDGTKVGTIDAKSSTLVWQAVWTSPTFAPGVHTVRFVHAGGGTYVDVDAITILP